MGKITYYIKSNKKILYLNIVEKYRCTNNCVFCDKEKLQRTTENTLYLDKKPEINEILSQVEQELIKHNPKMVVFCGLGEPTIHLDYILKIIKFIKKISKAEIRLNTNGQAQFYNPKKNVAQELKKAGLDVISISLNAFSKQEYNKLHNPKNPEKAFDSVLDFIKTCLKEKIEPYVSFILFPDLNKQKALEFSKKLGLDEEHVRFRAYIH